MSDREAFEKWWAEYSGNPNTRMYADSSGAYMFPSTQAAWAAWQAALQSGEPVALVVVDGEISYRSTADDQTYGMWCPVNYDTDHGFENGTKFYTTPQPVVPGDFAAGAEALRKTMLEASKAHLWPHIEGVFAVFAKVNSFNPVEGVVYQVLRDKALLSAGKENNNE